MLKQHHVKGHHVEPHHAEPHDVKPHDVKQHHAKPHHAIPIMHQKYSKLHQKLSKSLPHLVHQFYMPHSQYLKMVLFTQPLQNCNTVNFALRYLDQF